MHKLKVFSSSHTGHVVHQITFYVNTDDSMKNSNVDRTTAVTTLN